MESFRKDQQVQQLQQRLKELESRFNQQSDQNGGPQLTYRVDLPHMSQQSPVVRGAQTQPQGPMVMGGDPEMTARLLQLETEVAEKKQEIEQLKERVSYFFFLILTLPILKIIIVHILEDLIYPPRETNKVVFDDK